MRRDFALEMCKVSKSFGPVQALRGVDFSVRPGEVHALAGENGAGKSTLMNIADGILQPDSGEIRVNGELVTLRSPLDAQRFGIGLVHQEIALCPDVTVAENIFMAAIATSSKWFTSRHELEMKAQDIMDKLMPIPVTTMVRDLSIAEQQLVEIAKALTLNCKVLILDEPTAALTESEVTTLFGLMKSFRNQGIAQVYISHRMSEIFDICDRITVFRDGQYVGTDNVADVTPQQVVDKLVGRSLEQLFPPKPKDAPDGHPILSVKDLSDGEIFQDVSFELRDKEILGFAGLIGAGRTEIAETICGLRAHTLGEVTMDGQVIVSDHFADSIDKGIIYLSEDRKGAGLFLDLSIAQNITALDTGVVASGGFLSGAKEARMAKDLGRRVGLKCGSIHNAVATLSGGNQQKVAIARMLAVKPRLVFLDEPTRGVDVGAKAEIYNIVRELADQGTGVVAISSELTELIGLCDRIVVIHEGRLVGEVTGNAMTEERIIQMASGLTVLSALNSPATSELGERN